MSTTKLATKLTTTATDNIPVEATPVKENGEGRKFENAKFVGFNTTVDEETGVKTTTIIFHSNAGRRYTAQAPNSIRWKARLGTTYDVVVYDKTTPWVLLDPEPTEEEKIAYQATRVPEYKVVTLSDDAGKAIAMVQAGMI